MKSALLALAVFVAGSAAASAREPVTILAKPGATIESREADRARCEFVSRSAPEDDLPTDAFKNMPEVPMWEIQQYGVGGLIGAAIAMKAEYDMALRQARADAAALCMRNLGYVAIELSAEETAPYRGLSDDARKAWEAKFLNSDLSARIAAAQAPLVPPLPHDEHEAFTQGGIHIVPESLVAAPEPAKAGDSIVTGKAERVHTAKLAGRIEISDRDTTIVAEAGAPFFLVDFRRQWQPLLRPPGATWCGPFRQTRKDRTEQKFYCLSARHDGYEVLAAEGEAWMVAPAREDSSFPLVKNPIHLDEQAQDDLGPLDFAIAIKAIKSRVVQLVAVVRRDGKEVEIWHRAFAFSYSGETQVPLWSMQLTLTRGSDTVSAALGKDGNGSGWYQ